MMQPANLGNSNDGSVTWRRRGAREGGVFRQRQVRSGLVVVDEIGSQDAPKVPFIENNDVIQALCQRRSKIILASPQNPKILVRDDSEIVGDGVAPRRPLSWQSSAEEIVDGFGEEGEAGVEAVVGHLAMHDAP